MSKEERRHEKERLHVEKMEAKAERDRIRAIAREEKARLKAERAAIREQRRMEKLAKLQLEKMLPHPSQRLIVFDTETTGFCKWDCVVEIGAVEMIGGKVTGKTFHAYANPKVAPSKGAERIHGLSKRFLSKFPKVDVAIKGFTEFVNGDRMLAHNAAFDVRMMNQECFNFRLPQIKKEDVFCSMKWHRRVYPDEGHKLDAICRFLKVDNSHRKLHGALLDAEITAQCVQKFWELHPDLIPAAGGGDGKKEVRV